MQRQEAGVRGASQAEWFLMKAKVSLAVGVIKSRPPAMTGREHAESLAQKLRKQEESWRKKAEELQEEVLRLRQDTLIKRVKADAKRTTEAAGLDNSTFNVSQDLFGPGSDSCSTNIQLGSDSETPDFLLPVPEPPTTTPPHTPAPPVQPAPSSGTSILPHVHFLQRFCSLHRIETNPKGLESLWLGPDGGGGSLLEDSLCRLLDSVVLACRDPSPRPPDLVLQACQVACRAMELLCSQRLPSVGMRRRVEEALRELADILQHCNKFSGLEAAEQLMEYLITLGSCSLSKSFLIRHILSEISALADQLWQAFQAQESSDLEQFPVDRYQNSCRLFQVVEELLQKSQVPCRVEVEGQEGAEQVGFLGHLQQRVFLLSSEFPLFSIYMWRIASLLTSSDK